MKATLYLLAVFTWSLLYRYFVFFVLYFYSISTPDGCSTSRYRPSLTSNFERVKMKMFCFEVIRGVKESRKQTHGHGNSTVPMPPTQQIRDERFIFNSYRPVEWEMSERTLRFQHPLQWFSFCALWKDFVIFRNTYRHGLVNELD